MCFELSDCFGGGRRREDFGPRDSSAPSKPRPRAHGRRRERQQQQRYQYHHQDDEAGRKAHHDGAGSHGGGSALTQPQDKIGGHATTYAERVRALAAAAAAPDHRGPYMDFHHYPTSTYPSSATTLQRYD